ncbi:MAG: NAD-dependent protein deacylase [Bacillota bacterium]|nr:NAD-dependent protein deacylase [Bacillota bacterium]
MNKLQFIIDSSNYIVFFGGAGVSTESGLKDFRSVDGLYSEHYDVPPEEILSHHYFVQNREKFYEFYKEKLLCPDIKPNKAHLKLTEMEKAGKLAAIITQNIDGLHQMAGSTNVYELHGSVHRNYCETCKKFYDANYILNSQGAPKCSCGGFIKPDVVLYDESLDDEVVKGAVEHISKADALIVAGTSLMVYPAAGLLRYFHGKYLALINRDPTPLDNLANFVSHEKVGEVLGEITVKENHNG